MDYTMPPKYAAVSHLAGKDSRIETFRYDRIIENGNKTTLLYGSGNRTLSIPIDMDGNAADSILLSQGSKGIYINRMCTKNGLLTIGSKSPADSGCVSMMGDFAFIIPENTIGTIFTSLMFMHGKGLPVELVFENSYVKLYRITG